MEQGVIYDVVDPADESTIGFIKDQKFYDTHRDPEGMELGYVEGGTLISLGGRKATIIGLELLMEDGTRSLKLVPRK